MGISASAAVPRLVLLSIDKTSRHLRRKLHRRSLPGTTARWFDAAQNVAEACENAGHTVSVEEIQDLVEDEIMRLDCYEVVPATSSSIAMFRA